MKSAHGTNGARGGPWCPHHVTQRGNRRQQVFFSDEDYETYRTLLAEGCRAAQVKVLAYCLMPNHVHLILVPSDDDGLRAALGEAHRRYSRAVNFREGWRSKAPNTSPSIPR